MAAEEDVFYKYGPPVISKHHRCFKSGSAQNNKNDKAETMIDIGKMFEAATAATVYCK
jgi:hypothetical protein